MWLEKMWTYKLIVMDNSYKKINHSSRVSENKKFSLFCLSISMDTTMKFDQEINKIALTIILSRIEHIWNNLILTLSY